jgi:hypothetical protein
LTDLLISINMCWLEGRDPMNNNDLLNKDSLMLKLVVLITIIALAISVGPAAKKRLGEMLTDPLKVQQAMKA